MDKRIRLAEKPVVHVGNELGDPFLSSFVTGDFMQLSLVFIPNSGAGPGIGPVGKPVLVFQPGL